MHSGKRGRPLKLAVVSQNPKQSWKEQDSRCFFFCDKLCSAILTYRSLVWSLFTPRSVSWTEAAEAQTLKNCDVVRKCPLPNVPRLDSP
jgi:ribosomal protein L24E